MRTRALDRVDRRILDILQTDASTPLDEIGARVGLSRTPCWRRIQRLERDGVIRRRAALLDAKELGLGFAALVFVEMGDHAPEKLAALARAIAEMPEVVEAHRLAGDIDYMLKVVTADAAAYERFHARLLAATRPRSATTRVVLETLLDSGPLPVETGHGPAEIDP